MISVCQWKGEDRLCAKERHTYGGVAVVDAMTGKFIESWRGNAFSILSADVSGDSCEEIITVEYPYINIRQSTGCSGESPWNEQSYWRRKQNFNYYSP